MKRFLRKENGFTAVDIGIAMMVVVLFVAIISSVLYSVYISETEAKRTANALNIAVDIFETVGIMDFDSVNAAQIMQRLPELEAVQKSYAEVGAEAEYEIGPYTLDLGVFDYYDDVKLITLKIMFKVTKNREETVELKRIKTI